MRRLLPLLLLVQALLAMTAPSEARTPKKPLEVMVTEAYVEMHSGPGRGYPVTYVVRRGEPIQVLYKRTD